MLARLRTLGAVLVLIWPLAARAQDAGEISFWESVRDSQNPDELEAYVESYPDGKFLKLAKLKIDALRSAQPPEDSKPVAVAPCDLYAASPDDPSRPAGVPGVYEAAVNFGPAVPACAEAVSAEPQNARLRYQYARALYAGRDFERARLNYERAIELGHAEAYAGLGYMYSQGHGAAKNIARAVELLEKGVSAGSLAAHWNLAGTVYDGKESMISFNRALALLETANQRGSVTAKGHLGWLLLFGDDFGRTSDVSRGLELLGRAGDLGEPEALALLGIVHLRGLGDKLPANEKLGVSYLLRALAVPMNDGGAWEILGSAAEDGRGLGKDEGLARRLYERAAALGHKRGMASFSRLLREGIGGPKDVAGADYWQAKSQEGETAPEGGDADQQKACTMEFGANGMAVKSTFWTKPEHGSYIVGLDISDTHSFSSEMLVGNETRIVEIGPITFHRRYLRFPKGFTGNGSSTHLGIRTTDVSPQKKSDRHDIVLRLHDGDKLIDQRPVAIAETLDAEGSGRYNLYEGELWNPVDLQIWPPADVPPLWWGSEPRPPLNSPEYKLRVFQGERVLGEIPIVVEKFKEALPQIDEALLALESDVQAGRCDPNIKYDSGEKGGRTWNPEGGWLGVKIAPDDFALQGLFLAEVNPAGRAAKAGLRKGDLMVLVDGKKIIRPEDFVLLVSSKLPGDSIEIVFSREQSTFSAIIPLRLEGE